MRSCNARRLVKTSLSVADLLEDGVVSENFVCLLDTFTGNGLVEMAEKMLGLRGRGWVVRSWFGPSVSVKDVFSEAVERIVQIPNKNLSIMNSSV